MSVQNFDDLALHVGHPVEVVTYNAVRVRIDRRQNHQSSWHHMNYVVNVAIECTLCNEILLDYDRDNGD